MYSQLEQFNRTLFLLPDSWPVHGPWINSAAVMAAEYLFYFLPFSLVWLWLRGEPNERAGLVGATLAALLGLFINQIISGFWFHPRPFAIHLGQSLIPHIADSSFPSDHATFISALAFGLLFFSNYQKIAASFLFLFIVVGWSRIYVGVHFPLDIIGGALTAALAAMFILPLMPLIETTLVNSFCLPLYRRVFNWPILRGWCAR